MNIRVVVAVVALAVVVVAGWLLISANGAASAAEARAEVAEARADSMQAAIDVAWERYQRQQEDSIAQLAVALVDAQRRAREAAGRVRVHVDTLLREVPDTGAVARPLHDGIVAGFETLVRATGAERDAATADAQLWKGQWAIADSGWVQERAVNAALQVAVDRWHEAANPSWLHRLQQNLGMIGGVAGVTVVTVEILRGTVFRR